MTAVKGSRNYFCGAVRRVASERVVSQWPNSDKNSNSPCRPRPVACLTISGRTNTSKGKKLGEIKYSNP